MWFWCVFSANSCVEICNSGCVVAGVVCVLLARICVCVCVCSEERDNERTRVYRCADESVYVCVVTCCESSRSARLAVALLYPPPVCSV